MTLHLSDASAGSVAGVLSGEKSLSARLTDMKAGRLFDIIDDVVSDSARSPSDR